MLVATTTTQSVVLCPNQTTCQNQGVCYIVNGATRCVCPQGNKIIFLKI